jgi:hypothetical protein
MNEERHWIELANEIASMVGGDEEEEEGPDCRRSRSGQRDRKLRSLTGGAWCPWPDLEMHWACHRRLAMERGAL